MRISLEEKYEIFITVIRESEVLATSKVKMGGSGKKSNKKRGNNFFQNIQHFLHKTCFKLGIFMLQL